MDQIRTILTNQYAGVYKSLRIYWRLYGGLRAFVGSPYLHCAIILSFLNYPLWWSDCSPDVSWYDLALSIFPSLLSFTLGGYAVLLAFGGEKFLQLISGPDKSGESSPFLQINGALVHFILLQGLSLLFAVVGKIWSLDTGIWAWFGLLVSLYALLSIVPATLAIMRVAVLLDNFRDATKFISKNSGSSRHTYTNKCGLSLRTRRTNALRSHTKIT